MATITIQQEIQEYFASLNETEQRQVLEIVKTFMANQHAQPNSINIEAYNREIDEALAEVAQGNYITQEDMEKQSAQWYAR
jgi:hypothetical protein